MMLIVRLLWKDDPEEVWKSVISNLKGRETKRIRPLYISKLHDRKYVSVVFDVEKIDYIVKFVVEQVANCEEIVDTQTLSLMKPVFLPIPKERKTNLCRFSVFLKSEPMYYHDIYNELLNHQYEKDVFPTYIAYSLGEYDILVSMMAENLDTVKNLVDNKFSRLKGVTECTITPIDKSELLAKKETWRRLQRSLLHIPPWATKEMKKHYLYDYDFTFSDEYHCKLTGAMVDEL